MKPLSDWVAWMRAKGETHKRCEAPFRESTSEAAFIKITGDGEGDVFVHDVGVGTTYHLMPFTAVEDDGDGFGSADDYDALLDAAEALKPKDVGAVKRIIKSAIRLGLDPLDAEKLKGVIHDRTKLEKRALTRQWTSAESATAAEAREQGSAAAADQERAKRQAEHQRLASRVASLAADPCLLDRVCDAVHRLGVVGEKTAIKACYLTATSRLHRSGAIKPTTARSPGLGKELSY
jgi:hypothetical protein